jgi:hypothetical protein
MSELPAIDALIDESVCRCRAVRDAGVDQHEIEQLLRGLAVEHPRLAFIGMAYHLGMLTLVRHDCYVEENNLMDENL